jgi:nucleoside 2-deoxyribosyltransferase
MKVYLAGRFSDWAMVERHAEELRETGLDVVSTWHEPEKATDLSRTLQKAAVCDLNDLARAEILVLFSNRPGGRGGRHTELGYALARDITILLVGKRRQVFHYHPMVEHFPDWGECLAQLQLLESPAEVAT